jgi:hypothetical protein
VKDGVDISHQVSEIVVKGSVFRPTRVTVTYAACDVTIEVDEESHDCICDGHRPFHTDDGRCLWGRFEDVYGYTLVGYEYEPCPCGWPE